jgi:choline-sulfatase
MTPRHPNILVLLSDQLRPFELGCYGHPVIRTPHIDRLAAAGVRFEHAVTPNPLCTPARASLLSGQYSRTCTGMLGCVGEPDEQRRHFPDATLPELLHAAGYETRLVGKWHLKPLPRLLGFERAVYPRVDHRNSGQTYSDETGRSWVQEGYGPELEVAETCDFLAGPHDRPFFLFHNLCLPHMPYFDVPSRHRQRYAGVDLPLRPNTLRDGRLYHDEEAFKIYLYDYLHYREKLPWADRLPDGYDLHRLYADYAGMVDAVDGQVGAILNRLEACGLREETIVLFASDHGDNLGSHHLWNKHSINQEAVRIPWILAWPGQLAPAVPMQQVASLVDVAPTLLGLAGLDIPAHMQGRDLAPVLRGARDRIGDGASFIENIGGEIAVRTPTHLYGVMTALRAGAPDRIVTDRQFALYDLASDPFEQRNLAPTGAQADVARELCARILAWNQTTPWMPGTLGGTYGQGPG